MFAPSGVSSFEYKILVTIGVGRYGMLICQKAQSHTLTSKGVTSKGHYKQSGFRLPQILLASSITCW